MRFINVIAFIAFCCLNSLSAQDPTPKIKIYRTWITLNSEPFKMEGVLYELKDSSILVSSSVVMQDYSLDKLEVADLHITNIEIIKTRINSSVGDGALIGVITGFAVGGLIGLTKGGDSPCAPADWFCYFQFSTAFEKAIFYGAGLAVVGAGIGASVGSIKVTIPINANINNYNRHKNKLRKYAYMKP